MISVCMATYNGEKYIKEQIISILNQLGKEDEVVISDDMSTDATVEIIESLNDSRIKLYEHRVDHGVTRNFENALSHAKGDYIFLSDQDDVWMDNKVSKTLDYLQKFDFVVSDCITINEKEDVLSKSRIEDYNIKTGFWRLMIRTRYLGCCMAFNRKVLKASLPFPSNTYYMEHDLWLASIAECYFETALINEPLIYYRRHSDNVSDGGDGKGFPLWTKIMRRLYRIKCLIKINKIFKD